MPNPEPPSTPNFIQLLKQLQSEEAAQRQEIAGKGLDPAMQRLREWQSQRLRGTYADLLAEPAFNPACEFFLTDIYGPKDFTQRDHDAERLYGLLSRYLPQIMLRLVADTIRINHMTYRLDHDLLNALVGLYGEQETISFEQYAQAYRVCDNEPERREQIELLTAILEEVTIGARQMATGLALKAVRGPAVKLGWGELYDFFERGYQACKPMKDPRYFVQTIRSRELALLEKIFAGED
jgi:hypothetical protein